MKNRYLNRPVVWSNDMTATVITMAYDHRGRRIACDFPTESNTESKRMTYNGYLLIRETKDGNSASEYVWDPTEPVATKPLASLPPVPSPSSASYYVHDGNKNISALLSESGTILDGYIYSPFGQVVSSLQSTPITPFRFSSEYHDGALGAIYFNFRHYNPMDGRWIGRDPIEEQGGVNLYMFIQNNSINYFDYLGMDFWSYFLDSARMIAGAFTVYAGGVLAAGAGWTGVGAVAGIALMTIGADQFIYGASSIAQRLQEKNLPTGTLIQYAYRAGAARITGRTNSGLAQTLDGFYFTADIIASCATGYLSIRGAVTAIKGLQPIHTAERWISVKGVLQYEFYIEGGASLMNAGTVVATEFFSIVVSGISFVESPTNLPPDLFYPLPNIPDLYVPDIPEWR